MRHKYKRLDLHDRCMIEAYLTQGKQYAAIAALLSRNRSSIAREITHHSKPLSGYDASYAQHLSDQSRLVCRRKKRMDTVATANYVLYWLKQGRSPEGIAGRLRYEIEQGLQPCSIQISHETIYQYIYCIARKSEKLWQYLRYGKMRRTHHHSRRTHRDIIPGREFIDRRPAYIRDRQEIGHWETDTVMYGKQVGINTLVERTTRYVMLTRLADKTPSQTQRAITARLHDHLCKTITADNGIENKHHREIAQQLKIKFYFCHPYHSWEKGTNENTNGMLRRYLPRQVSLDTVTDDELADIEYELNNRPRKILGFKTPYEVLQSHYQFVALAI